MWGLHTVRSTDYRTSSPHVCPAVEKQASHPSDTDKTNTWIIVGVVVPAVVVIIIISILYWKLCRTDKLEFQPDTMSTVQQRQKVRERTTVWLYDSYRMKCNIAAFFMEVLQRFSFPAVRVSGRSCGWFGCVSADVSVILLISPWAPVCLSCLSHLTTESNINGSVAGHWPAVCAFCFYNNKIQYGCMRMWLLRWLSAVFYLSRYLHTHTKETFTKLVRAFFRLYAECHMGKICLIASGWGLL